MTLHLTFPYYYLDYYGIDAKYFFYYRAKKIKDRRRNKS